MMSRTSSGFSAAIRTSKPDSGHGTRKLLGHRAVLGTGALNLPVSPERQKPSAEPELGEKIPRLAGLELIVASAFATTSGLTMFALFMRSIIRIYASKICETVDGLSLRTRFAPAR